MPIERIIIKPDEFRTKDTAGNTTFWSGNQYLKTASGGQFKAGGYERAPVVAGQGSTLGDQTQFGGFIINVAGDIGSASRRFDALANVTTEIALGSGPLGATIFGGPPLRPSDFEPVVSQWFNFSFNGTPNVGSFRWYGYMYAVPIQTPTMPYRPVGYFFQLIDLTLVGDGTYVFPIHGTYYNTYDGSVSTLSDTQKYIAIMSKFITKPPVTLELAVTP